MPISLVDSNALRILVRRMLTIPGSAVFVAMWPCKQKAPMSRWARESICDMNGQLNQESRAFTIIGADGALFSIRRSCLLTPAIRSRMISPSRYLLSPRRRVVYEAAARATEVVVPDVKASSVVRSAIRAVIKHCGATTYSSILSGTHWWPGSSSHTKLLRWLVPVLLVTT